jgi:hypothetical protein
MAKQFDEEEYITYELEAFNAEDVALNGEQATFLKTSFVEPKTLKTIEDAVKKKGFDTFEVTEIRGTIRRYSVE